MSRPVSYRSPSERMFFSGSRRRTWLTLVSLTLLLVCAFLLSIGMGGRFTPPADVLRVVLGNGSSQEELILGMLRLPRIVLAMLVGAGLAVSGSLLQGMIRNPLASPDIIGITGGAAFAAVAFITYAAGAISIRWLPVAAFVGAGLVSIVIYLLAWNRGVTPVRLVLIGIGFSAMTGSLTMLMLVLSPIKAAGRAYMWLTGSVYGASWENVHTLLPWLLVLVPLSMAMARHVDVQQLGDDTAKGLGSPVQYYRAALTAVSVALAGSAVAVGGAFGFIGLIAPHIARKLVGPKFGALIPASALTGGLMLLIADTVARTAFLPLDIPAGVFTAGVGAPFFIYLLYRNRNR